MSGASSLKITGRLGSEGAVANVGFASGTSARVPHTPHTHVPPHTHTHTRRSLYIGQENTPTQTKMGESQLLYQPHCQFLTVTFFLEGSCWEAAWTGAE